MCPSPSLVGRGSGSSLKRTQGRAIKRICNDPRQKVAEPRPRVWQRFTDKNRDVISLERSESQPRHRHASAVALAQPKRDRCSASQSLARRQGRSGASPHHCWQPEPWPYPLSAIYAVTIPPESGRATAFTKPACSVNAVIALPRGKLSMLSPRY